VLHRGDDVMLDLVDAERVDPRNGGWLEDIDALLGDEPWHDTLAVGVVDAECNTASGKCGQSPQGLEIGWQETGRFPVIHGGQQATFGSTVRELFYQTWVSEAQDITMPLCTDQPLGDYRFAIWGMEP